MNYPRRVNIIELENAPFRNSEDADAWVRSHGVIGLMSNVDTGGKGSDALRTYCDRFGFVVVSADGGKWAVEAALYPEDWTNVVESAREATPRLPPRPQPK